MLDLTKPLSTRDGRPVRLLATDLNNRWSIVGAVTEPNGTETVQTWSPSGHVWDDREENKADLVNAPETRTVTLYLRRPIHAEGNSQDWVSQMDGERSIFSDPAIASKQVTFNIGEFE